MFRGACRVTASAADFSRSTHSDTPRLCQDSRPARGIGAGAGDGQARPARDIDLALHLPLRYEDETRLTPIGRAARRRRGAGRGHGRRQPHRDAAAPPAGRAAARRAATSCCCASCTSTRRSRRAWRRVPRVRARGEVRGGFFGREMVHPSFKAVAEHSPLPTALTPVYPTSAQLPQAYLRKAVVSALARAPLHELLPPELLPAGLPSLREALQFLHHPPPQASLAALDDHSHPAWQRLKFDELLAQQLSQAAGAGANARSCARRRCAAGARTACTQRLLAALPFALTAAQQRVGAEIAADLARPQPMHRLLQGDVGSGKTVVAALAAARGHRLRLAMRADGADRDPGRAALPQAGAVARTAGRGRGLAHRQPQGQGARADGRARGHRRGRAGGRHARGDPGRRALRPARAGDRRRAAPLRRAAAAGAARASWRTSEADARAAPADDDAPRRSRARWR